jgi:RNA polymerase sigma-70 factor (ECF subfamily)
MDSLLQRLQSGDDAAFAEIYKQSFEYLVNQSVKIIKDVEISENMVQELFITFWIKKTLHKLTLKKSSLRGYLCQSIKYRCFRFIKQSKLLITIDEEHNLIAEDENRHIKIPALNFLTGKQMKAVQAMLTDGFNRNKYAALNGISVSTLNVHIHTACKAIRSRYNIEDFLQ